MDATLIEYKDFLVAGLTIEADADSDFTGVWDALNEQLTPEQLTATQKLQKVGLCMPTEDPGGFHYTAGFMVPNIPAVAALGLTGVIVPASMYATAHLVGPAAEVIKGGFEYLMTQYIPSQPLQPTGVAIEVYGPGDVTAQDYRMYAWVGVVSEKTVEELVGL
ncbi:GyrI-like domain-containing protein [Rothia sp. ZJ932]|uniref:GyrI-like domain-containing protein n=1 Tax=Rothia sp. ZJ932 TaxID=2810516 RepID=UPI001966DFD5|nr:effector binding domain-containing protein [Rothia sp. ZJ932]QRZ61972.1 effector binding domain-containing protein [Rothia sp. ZJ932]